MTLQKTKSVGLSKQFKEQEQEQRKSKPEIDVEKEDSSEGSFIESHLEAMMNHPRSMSMQYSGTLNLDLINYTDPDIKNQDNPFVEPVVPERVQKRRSERQNELLAYQSFHRNSFEVDFNHSRESDEEQ